MLTDCTMRLTIQVINPCDKVSRDESSPLTKEICTRVFYPLRTPH